MKGKEGGREREGVGELDDGKLSHSSVLLSLERTSCTSLAVRGPCNFWPLNISCSNVSIGCRNQQEGRAL